MIPVYVRIGSLISPTYVAVDKNMAIPLIPGTIFLDKYISQHLPSIGQSGRYRQNPTPFC